MIFKKTGRMIDVRELQRRGVVRIPEQEINIPTSSDGFVELGSNGNITKEETPKSTSNAEFFNFMDAPTSQESTIPNNNFSTESNGYNKREVDEKITNLDNKIYKLENRMEVLEKKLSINQPSNPAVGVMGW
ncbi:hypothetical protein GOV13_03495 [Candidatus Pacearchaeota archaeon]|nr:hypothetical protein [Candidatus Pacearchaeota archaeon]